MSQDRERLLGLLESLCDGRISPAEHERLQERLAADVDARQLYFDYVDLRLQLRQWQRTALSEQRAREDAQTAPACAPIVIQTDPSMPTPFAPPYASIGGFAFSYVVASLLVGFGLLLGWACQISVLQPDHQSAQVAPTPAPAHPEREVVFVGRVTGEFSCEWSDPATATLCYANVPLNRKYALASGLLEITYNTGARVILQGPCVYEVNSRSSGRLSSGRLTARVVKKTTKKPATTPPEWFCVHTPTATVTDLGTEFGVEVDKSGASNTHVYEGKVQLTAIGDENAQPLLLAVNQSARTDRNGNASVVTTHATSRKLRFVREMPKPVPIKLFNTGADAKEGEPDPHWQVVARDDDPDFKPRAALTRLPGTWALDNDPDRSKWISLIPVDEKLPENVIYVFRTTFDLTGMNPSTAVLTGRFIADDRVATIRLNGRDLTVPVQHDGEPFDAWSTFHARAGFVKGENVLEVGVLNACPFTSPPDRGRSRMMFRMELEGKACLAAENANQQPKP